MKSPFSCIFQIKNDSKEGNKSVQVSGDHEKKFVQLKITVNYLLYREVSCGADFLVCLGKEKRNSVPILS
jgi:hypothetical protein